MTPREVAEMLQVSTHWIQVQCRKEPPMFPFYRLGNDMRRFLRSEVLRSIDAQRRHSVETASESKARD